MDPHDIAVLPKANRRVIRKTPRLPPSTELSSCRFVSPPSKQRVPHCCLTWQSPHMIGPLFFRASIIDSWHFLH